MSQLTTHSAPLVGMHFRPPAKALLQALPASHPLELRPEPTNPYDANAVAVWLDAQTLSDDALEELRHTLPPMGCDLDELFEKQFWQLGYMAKGNAEIHHAPIALRIEGHNTESAVSGEGFLWNGFPAKLGFDGAGKPLVTFSF